MGSWCLFFISLEEHSMATNAPSSSLILQKGNFNLFQVPKEPLMKAIAKERVPGTLLF
jgi:hypothetical protein